MDRLEKLRLLVDGILDSQQNIEIRRCGYVHLYGVSLFCSLLAQKRGLDPDFAAAMGMLHDISSYKTGFPKDHARLGAIEARTILLSLNLFSELEIDIICTAIKNHSTKIEKHTGYDELLKDADVLHHHFYNVSQGCPEKEVLRAKNLFSELGL